MFVHYLPDDRSSIGQANASLIPQSYSEFEIEGVSLMHRLNYLECAMFAVRSNQFTTYVLHIANLESSSRLPR